MPYPFDEIPIPALILFGALLVNWVWLLKKKRELGMWVEAFTQLIYSPIHIVNAVAFYLTVVLATNDQASAGGLMLFLAPIVGVLSAILYALMGMVVMFVPAIFNTSIFPFAEHRLYSFHARVESYRLSLPPKLPAEDWKAFADRAG